jgi:GntR family transcriptional regulator
MTGVSTEEPAMHAWNDSAPIFRQLADRLTDDLLDGHPPEGEAMPSVRQLASRYLVNPLTVSRALQALSDDGLLESRRGLGSYVRPGAQARLREIERQRFLHEEWPRMVARMKRLGLTPEQLIQWEQT